MATTERKQWLSMAIACLLPVLACLIQWILWEAFKPFVWFLFYPAIFLSSQIGGFKGGIAGTGISILLVIFFFIPPQLSFHVENTSNLYPVVVFTAMGVLFSLTHERLKRARQHIQQLYEKTKELDEIKSQLFANVSHELRTPLTLILGPVKRQLARKDLKTEERNDLQVIERNAQLLYRHVSDLLDIAKLEAKRMTMHYTRQDLAELVRFVASHFEVLAAEKEIEFGVEASEIVSAEIDQIKCQRIIFNLLSNAFKFTPNGGMICISLSANVSNAIIQVRDNGPGIPSSQHTLIFERFRQTEDSSIRRHGGTGLGLSIAKEFAELHHGQVRLRDTPGGGATFTVELPMSAPFGTVLHDKPQSFDETIHQQMLDELRPQSVQQNSGIQQLNSTAPIILIVEDNQDMSHFLVQALSPLYRVIAAFNGKEGLDKALATRPDLIISDVMMPGMSGDQMVRSLRANHKTAHTPIIMLTAKVDDALKLRMLQQQVQAYMQKPFLEEELRVRVKGLLTARQQVQESLDASNDQLRLMVDFTYDWEYWLGVDGRLIHISPACERITGYSVQEFLNDYSLMTRIIHPEDQERMNHHLINDFQNQEKAFQFDFRVVRKDGSERWISHACQAVHNRKGKFMGRRGSNRDITERKQLEDRQRILYEEAQQNVKIRTELLEEVNHRVKNNLTSIVGLIEMESQSCRTTPHDISGMIVRIQNRINAMITVHELLIQSHWMPLSLEQVVRQITQGASSSALQKNLNIEYVFTPETCRHRKIIHRQATVLALILNELVINSTKHAFAGQDNGKPGKLKIETAIFTSDSGNEMLKMICRDNGAGFPEEVLSEKKQGIGMKLIRGNLRSLPEGCLSLSNDHGAVASVVFRLAVET